MTDNGRGYLARQRSYWNERARTRTQHVTGAVGFLRPVEIALTAAALRGPRVLDAGCGDGAFATWCRRLHPGLQIAGLDFSDEMVALAKARGLDAVVGDMVELPWADNEFASAYAVRSVKNVLDEGDQARALRELARVSSRRVVVVDSIRTATTSAEPEFNLYPTTETIVGTLEDAGFRLAWSAPLRDWYWLVRRRDRFGNERIFVFDAAR